MEEKNRKRVPIWARQLEVFRPSGGARSRNVTVFIVAALVVGTVLSHLQLPSAERLRRLVGFAANWTPPLLPALLFIGAVVILLLWKLPALQVGRSKALTDENRFDRENEARKTLAQILGGVFLLAGLYSSAQSFDLSRDGQITDRFTKAIDQLGASDGAGRMRMEVRLGGIYALERIARDSERDHRVIMEVLTEYVREHSVRKKDENKTLCHPACLAPLEPLEESPSAEPDIIAILAVLGRREVRFDKGRIELPDTYLVRAKLIGATFSNANLGGVDLRGAVLNGARLNGAQLDDAVLVDADLIGTDLSGANLVNADLHNADIAKASFRGADLRQAHLDKYLDQVDLTWANLTGVDLSVARLTGANLTGANLTGANLSRAWLDGANFSKANLTGADFTWTDLRRTLGITQKQIDLVRGNAKTELPDGIRRPSWPL